MTDFLDRYGEQLRAAQPEAPAHAWAKVRAAVLRFHGLRRRHKVTLGVLAALAVAAPAAAIVAPWQPSLYRPGVDDPVATSDDPVSADASSWLGVLRRSQTAQDRAASAPALRRVGAGDLADGVQTAGIRSLAKGWALVPVTSVKGASGNAKPGLCLANAKQLACGQNDMIKRVGMGGASASPTQTEFIGLVPDGVAQVRFTPLTADPISVDVSSNFYVLTVPGSGSSGPVKPPPDYNGPKIAPPPMPLGGQIEWLDEAGNVVGPARK